MASDAQTWINEKIKAGYDTEKIKAVLLKNGFDENSIMSMIKEAKMQEFRGYAPAKTQGRKKYGMKTTILAIFAIIMLYMSMIMITSAGNERCNIFTFGDERHYCDAVNTHTSVEKSISSCTKIDDERLAAACIDRAVQNRDDIANKDVCSTGTVDIKIVCIAAIDRADARKDKRAVQDSICENIQDTDIKTWCLAKNLENSALSKSILKCGEIRDQDYRYLCRADKYRIIGDIEEYDTCQLIDKSTYQFVCLN